MKTLSPLTLSSMMVFSATLMPMIPSLAIAQSGDEITRDTSSREITRDTSSRDIQRDTSSRDIQRDTSSREIQVDTSTGEVNNSSTSPSVAPSPQPVPVEMVARLAAVEATFKTRGDIRFSLAGDMMTASGKIEGLQPGMRYQLAVLPLAGDVRPVPQQPAAPQVTPQNDGVQRNDKDPATGAPLAGAPGAGAPQAVPPQAGKPDAGQPDGTDRPGAPGTGEGTSVTGDPTSREVTPAGEKKPDIAPGSNKLSGLLGIVTADAAGTTNINLTVRSVTLTAGPGNMQGRTVTLTTVPADGDATPVLVASGTLEVSLAGAQPTK